MRGLLNAPAIRGLLGGVGGVILGLLAWHLYTDHLAFHAVLDFVNRNADKIAKLP